MAEGWRQRAKKRLDSLSPEARRELDEWWASAEAETPEDVACAPQEPRVFFPGDIVPAESAVMDGDGRVMWSPNDWTADANLLDIDLPSLEERQAIINRACAERGLA